MRYRIRGFTLDDRSFLLGTWISLSVAKTKSCFGNTSR